MTASIVARIHFTAVASVATADSVQRLSRGHRYESGPRHSTAVYANWRYSSTIRSARSNHQYRSSSSGKTRTVMKCIVRHCSEQAAGERRCVDAAAASQNSGRRMGAWTNRRNLVHRTQTISHIVQWFQLVKQHDIRPVLSCSVTRRNCWTSIVLVLHSDTSRVHRLYTIQTARAWRVRTRWLTMMTDYELCTTVVHYYYSQRRLSSRPTRTRRHNQTRLVVVRQSKVAAWQQKPSDTASTVYYYFIFPDFLWLCGL